MQLLIANTASITSVVQSNLQSGSNVALVEIQFLAERRMKVAKESRCTAYVDVTLAASRLPAGTPEAAAMRKDEVANSLTAGWTAKCYVEKTPLEALPSGLRNFWEPRHAKLSLAPKCSAYVAESTSLVYGPGTESEIQLDLSQMFVEAAAQGCSRN